jgi:serine/threonine-protein kinase BUR1
MAIVSLEKDSNGQSRFPGCSNIRDFEFIGKLGEGTFGYRYIHMNCGLGEAD